MKTGRVTVGGLMVLGLVVGPAGTTDAISALVVSASGQMLATTNGRLVLTPQGEQR